MVNLGKVKYDANMEGMMRLPIHRSEVSSEPGSIVALHLRHMRCRDRSQPNWNGVLDVSGYPAPGDKYSLGGFSYLHGQRLSFSTCPGEDHLGPMYDDGTFMNKSVPEIDVFEPTVFRGKGTVQCELRVVQHTEIFIAPDPTITKPNL